MTTESTFLVEDFLDAITSQLDRTQDALRLKAVNRPLTYAIREFSMDLKVFVEMGVDGQVRFRATGPNEEGASVVQIGFTTVTRPMIEENTVSLSAVRSPSLDELGLADDERRRLERLGVRNAAQLARLGRSTGETTVARYAGIPVNRLRSALASGRPSVVGAAPVAAHPVTPVTPAAPQQPARPAPEPEPAAAPAPAPGPGPVRPRPGVERPVGDVSPSGPGRGPRLEPLPVQVPAATRRLRIQGRNLADAVDAVRLDGHPLDVDDRDDDGIVVDLGDVPTGGALEVDLGEDGVVTIALAVAGDGADVVNVGDDGAADDAEGPGDAGEAPAAAAGGDDPWRPA